MSQLKPSGGDSSDPFINRRRSPSVCYTRTRLTLPSSCARIASQCGLAIRSAAGLQTKLDDSFVLSLRLDCFSPSHSRPGNRILIRQT